MAIRKQVTCVSKSDSKGINESINKIGGLHWKHSVKNAIYYLEKGVYSYFIQKNGFEIDLIVATQNGNKYLKTKNDEDTLDNLMSMPECR